MKVLIETEVISSDLQTAVKAVDGCELIKKTFISYNREYLRAPHRAEEVKVKLG